MAEYFVDETDPTIGKLYINYPMMESFKDCDSFEDDDYISRMVCLSDIKQYKKIVGNRKMANKRVDGYSKSDFLLLTRQNVKKLGYVCQVADAPLDYETYLKEAEQLNVLQHEIEFVKSLKKIAVLNTSVFFALDYYGNKDGFYDNTIKNQ